MYIDQIYIYISFKFINITHLIIPDSETGQNGQLLFLGNSGSLKIISGCHRAEREELDYSGC